MLVRRDYSRMTGAASAVLGGLFTIGALAWASDGFTDDAMHGTPSVIIGLVVGISLLIAAFGLMMNRAWGVGVGLIAHFLGIAAVVYSMIAINQGYGDGRPSLAIPGVMLLLLVLNLVALFRARPRNPLKRMGHEIAAKMS